MLTACPLTSGCSSLTHRPSRNEKRCSSSTIHKAHWKLSQKQAISLGSQSDNIETNTPCNWKISRMYNLQNSSRVKVISIAKKCADFVSRSTITRTASCPHDVRGKRVTKSILMSSHFHSTTFNDWSNPVSLWCSAFTC